MKNVKDLGAFALIGRGLTLVSLGATLVVVSPGLAGTLGADGESKGRTVAAWVTAIVVALVLDVAWVGALRLFARSLQARRRPLAVVAATVVAVATAGSAIALHVYGGMWLLSLPPVTAMAFLALDVWAASSLPDADTETNIREMEADGRNQRALMDAHVRALRLQGELAAMEETAGTGALAHQGRARAMALMSAQVVRMETTAAVRDALKDAAKRTGVEVPRELPEAAPARTASRAEIPGTDRRNGAAGTRTRTALGSESRFAPKHSDEELMDAAREIFRTMGTPRSQTRFEAAMKDAGYGAKASRLREVYRAVLAEFEDITVDAITSYMDRPAE